MGGRPSSNRHWIKCINHHDRLCPHPCNEDECDQYKENEKTYMNITEVRIQALLLEIEWKRYNSSSNQIPSTVFFDYLGKLLKEILHRDVKV